MSILTKFADSAKIFPNLIEGIMTNKEVQKTGAERLGIEDFSNQLENQIQELIKKDKETGECDLVDKYKTYLACQFLRDRICAGYEIVLETLKYFYQEYNANCSLDAITDNDIIELATIMKNIVDRNTKVYKTRVEKAEIKLTRYKNLVNESMRVQQEAEEENINEYFTETQGNTIPLIK